MNGKTVGIIAGVIVIIVLVWYFAAGPGNITPLPTVTSSPTQSTAASASPTESPLVSAGISVGPTVKSFNLVASNFKFDKTELRVKQGDRVRITLTNGGGVHDWRLDEFSAGTKQISAGQTDTIEFVVNKKGSFQYYCSVGSHRAMGMVGTLIVE